MKTKSFPLAIKAVNDDGIFEGYGAVFNNVDKGNEKVLPGAFAESLSKHLREGTKVRMLWQHDPSEPIGVWDELSEDGKGLRGTGRLILDIQKAREVHALMKNGAIGGLSVGYNVIDADDDKGVRVLKNLDLWEVSPVVFPMNPRAKIDAVKSSHMDEFARRLRDGDPMPTKEFEGILREAGVPKSMAVQIASVGYAKAIRSESEGDQANDGAAFLNAMRS